MTFFPSLSDQYFVENDHDLQRLFDNTYVKYTQVNQSYWSEADTDLRFATNDQTLYNDIMGNLPAFRRRQFAFNLSKRVLNMISGYQRQHRKSTICTPIENRHSDTSDQFTKLLFHINNKSNVLSTISDAFLGAVIAGMNLLHVWMDYRADPVNGEMVVDNLSYNAYMIDPYFRKMDMSDCNSLLTRKYLSRQQVNALLPGREAEILSISGFGNRDGKFQYLPESYNYGMQDLLIWDEIWYQDSRKAKIIADLQTGESKEWTGDDEDLKEYLARYPEITVFTHNVPTVKLGIIVQGKTMYHGPNPLGIDKYPFVPVFAYFHPESPYFPYRIQGVMRSIRDAQYLFNRRRIIELDILESQVNSGFYFKEDDLVNPQDVFLQGQGRGLAIKNTGRPINDSVQKIEPAQVPPSMIQLSELLSKEISQISGVNEELLGAAQDDSAGILSMLRQGAGLTTLQILFDNLDFAQKKLGDLQIDIIQKNWTPGKVERILGEKPTDEFYNRAFAKYDCTTEEGLNTSTQRQLEFAQLLQLRETGIPVPTDILIECSTLQGKKKLIEGIMKNEEQQQQIQTQQAQAQIAVLKAQIEDLKAKAMANEGLGFERASRVAENEALAIERVAAAQRDRDMGTLDKVRAVKELSTTDLENFKHYLDLLHGLQDLDQKRALAPHEAATAKAQATQAQNPPEPTPSQAA